MPASGCGAAPTAQAIHGRRRPLLSPAGSSSTTLAVFECRLERIVEQTTHMILIGEIVETVLGDGHSLVYLEGGFASVPRPLSAASPG